MGTRATLVLVAVAAWIPAAVSAADGRIELSQACSETGCVPGDLPGLPITLGTPGSYVLTSNLTVPDANTSAIELGADADRSTIDLNGFAILGPTVCSFIGTCAPVGTGHGIVASGSTTDVTVRNGRVIGMGGHGVFLQNRDRVEGVTAQGNGGVGIEVGPFSSVLDSQAITNGGEGIRVDENTSGGAFDTSGQTLVSRNVAVRNGLVDSGARDIEGGADAGDNVCSDNHCVRRGQRRYYLRAALANGAEAGSLCDTGFGVASVWELYNPGALQYDRARGHVSDEGSGPPSGSGWAYANSTSDCLDWSSTAGSGSLIQLETDPALQDVGPWAVSVAPCASTFTAVWCIEK